MSYSAYALCKSHLPVNLVADLRRSSTVQHFTWINLSLDAEPMFCFTLPAVSEAVSPYLSSTQAEALVRKRKLL